MAATGRHLFFRLCRSTAVVVGLLAVEDVSMADFTMTSNQPYLLRAVYEWILDNHCTPHLLVDASDERVQVPREHVRDGQIVLNITPSAVGQFHWDNDHIEFSARFAGVARSMWIPMSAVRAIYARENGEGMAFALTDAQAAAAGEHDDDREERDTSSEAGTAGKMPPPDDEPTPPATPIGGRPRLKVVK